MKRLVFYLFINLIFLISFSNCNKDTAQPNLENDEAVISELAESDEEDLFLDWGIDDGAEENMYDGYDSGTMGKTSAMLDTVLRFGRIIEDRGIRRLNINRSNRDTIKVGLVREFFGRFMVLAAVDTSDVIQRVRRRLRHAVARKAVYVKNPNVTDLERHPRRGWELHSVSMGAGASKPNSTIVINEITVTTSEGQSHVFTDPLNTMFLVPEGLLRFSPDEVVTVQVKLDNTTANPVDPMGTGSTEKVLLHHGTSRHHHARKHLEYVGTDPGTGAQVYEGSWEIGRSGDRVFHAIIDAIDNGTIYDDDTETYPYNSTTWGAPYLVIPN